MMDLFAQQLSVLSQEVQRQAEWDKHIYMSLARYQAEVGAAKAKLGEQLLSFVGATVAPSQSPEPQPLQAAEAEEEAKWLQARKDAAR